MERRHSLAAATLDTLPITVAVIDESGEILLTNRSWRTFGESDVGDDSSGGEDDASAAATSTAESGDYVGANYVATAEGADDEHAERAADGLRSVLEGERASFSLEYPCHSPSEKRWFLMRANRFTVDGEVRVSVAHVDITDRKLAEIEADETAAELRTERRALEHVLDRIDGLVRQVTDVVVDAGSRTDVERGVCERLVQTDPFTMAWIGRVDVTGDRLVPQERAARPDVSLEVDDLDLTDDRGHPAVDAVTEGDPRVVHDVDAFDGAPRWWPDDGARPFRSAAALPLTYGDVEYGVLALFAAEPDAFDPRELVVLESLARTVATAINALEARRLLTADTVVELAVRITDPTLFAAAFADRLGTSVDYRGLTHRDDGAPLLFFGVDTGAVDETGIDPAGPGAADGGTDDGVPDAVETAALASDAVEAATVVTAGDGTAVVEVVVEEGLVGTLNEHGAAIREFSASSGVVDLEIDLPDGRSARALYDRLEERYDGVELLRYRERERPPETPQDVLSRLESSLTDRQLTALQRAYYAGYFDWPRAADGDELAETMDIARPTFHQHLRAAQRKLLEELFGPTHTSEG